MTALLEVREGRVEDADAVASIHVRSWQVAYRGLIAQEILDSLSIPERAANWRRFIAKPLPTSLGILVAGRDGAVLGWASLGSGRDIDGRDDGEVYGIYADPDAWSTGVGHALLAAAENRLTDAGHTRAYLWVLDGNDRADAFYARQGWELDGATKIDERPGFTLQEHRRVKQLEG
jgi:GNAT superfamily N-acetyltransferase